jgi:hypothetical protein
VVWLAHSLGTVVSYNVVSDLFTRAEELETGGDELQRQGARRFRESFARFVTIGSPLDKIACLAGEAALRPWPDSVPIRTDTRADVRQQTIAPGEPRRWWVNYFNTLDPVSGSLDQRLICRGHAPVNLHVQWRHSFLGPVPGAAHIAYWGDTDVLVYLLSRVYSASVLTARKPAATSSGGVFWRLLIGFVVWAAMVAAVELAVVVAVLHYLVWRDTPFFELLTSVWTWGTIGGLAVLAFVGACAAHLSARLRPR